jgi:hypothetical protein
VLDSVKKDCSVSAPAAPAKSAGLRTMNKSATLLLLISGLIKVFWVN